MSTSDALDLGRQPFRRQAWADAYAQLSAADREAPLEREDLERLATAAYLIGRDNESVDVWTRAYHEWARLGDTPRAARCAFWVAFGLLNRQELAVGGGWVDRAQRLLDNDDVDCVERGHLRYLVALRSVFGGDVSGAHAAFSQAAKIGQRFRDPELTALALIGEGRCLIYLGEIAEGVALLDEAMVAVTAEEVSPIAVGDLYCTVIDCCQGLFDLRRAREWTAALSRWCDAQPQLVLYRGQCLVHRAEIMQLHGEWSLAMDEAQHACDRLAEPAGPLVVGAALYLTAELHRLRGAFAQAEQAYREAGRLGRELQPGLAKLRLAQGRVDAAVAAIRAALDEAGDRVARAAVLPTYIEVMLAADDVHAARPAADELSGVAATFDSPLLHALSAQATGAVLLAEGDTRAALAALRAAWKAWQQLEAPYEAARARILVALACRGLGDEDGAEMELDAARWVLQELGAAPDLARVEKLSLTSAPKGAAGLTAREVQVLRLVAAGRSNRAIAADLVISEHTVARHVQNIFTKLNLASRTAAAAFAFEHDLV